MLFLKVPWKCPYCTLVLSDKQLIHRHCKSKHKDIIEREWKPCHLCKATVPLNFLPITIGQNKLKCLSLASFFRLINTTTGAYSSEAPVANVIKLFTGVSYAFS